jgi:hypothetical protein
MRKLSWSSHRPLARRRHSLDVKRLAALVVVLSAVLAGGAVYAILPAGTTVVPAIELVRGGHQAAGSERPQPAIEVDGDGAGVVIPEVVPAGEDDSNGPGGSSGSDDRGSDGGDSDGGDGTNGDSSVSGGGGDGGDGSSETDDGR